MTTLQNILNDTDRHAGYDSLMQSLRGRLKEHFKDCEIFRTVNNDFLGNHTVDRLQMSKKIDVDFINATLFKDDMIIISVYGASLEQIKDMSQQLSSICTLLTERQQPLKKDYQKFKLAYTGCPEKTGQNIADILHSNTADLEYS